uniref:YopX protein n=1 Tax=viral metagenome TaxID=1070528 RepID=A0A6M3LKK6_9ZZZZ
MYNRRKIYRLDINDNELYEGDFVVGEMEDTPVIGQIVYDADMSAYVLEMEDLKFPLFNFECLRKVLYV